MLNLNTVETLGLNGEIDHYKQFFRLPQCFHNSSAAGASESVCMYVGKVKHDIRLLFTALMTM